MYKLTHIPVKNEFVENFKGDDSGDLKPRQTPGMFYSKAKPTPVKKVELIGWSDELAKELEIVKPTTQEEIDILGGNALAAGMQPYAACYAGHQFGNWAGQLGDGRAITLAELQTTKGKTWELQLKGAGPTAYSRRADGRAVLRSSVREYLMSEAMHYLGVPTTRALSLVTTGDAVMRDMFYNGNPELEPGAIVLRVAPSFLRFGNFEILAGRGEAGNLRQLVNWTIDRYYPHLTGENRILDWYKEIVERTAKLMVEWQRVGFVHGVMNTDNMSILGLTIDYGPYSFVDDYDINFTPNTTDLPGRRYAFGKQPSVAKWNLGCLGGALAPLFENTDELVAILDGYDEFYWNRYYTMMSYKLGLDELKEGDDTLFAELEKQLRGIKPDMTIFYQMLIELPMGVENTEEVLRHFDKSFYRKPTKAEGEMFFHFIKKYLNRIGQNSISNEKRVRKMQGANPRFVLRNYLLSNVIEEISKGDDKLWNRVVEAMQQPYSNKGDEFFQKRPEWATSKAGCSMLSCSS